MPRILKIQARNISPGRHAKLLWDGQERPIIEVEICINGSVNVLCSGDFRRNLPAKFPCRVRTS